SLVLPEAGVFHIRIYFESALVQKISRKRVSGENDTPYANYLEDHAKGLEIDILPQQEFMLWSIYEEQKNIWSQPIPKPYLWQIHPGAKGRVIARIRSRNAGWSLASIGLSGRNTQHSSEQGLPSLDVKIISGPLFYGLQEFKCYTLGSKTSGRDINLEAFLSDIGLKTPREDFVAVSMNGKKMGLMEVHEGLGENFFEFAQIQEGAVLGYDADTAFSEYDSYRLEQKSYFKKSRYSTKGDDIATEDFFKKLCLDSFAKGTAFAYAFFGVHGLNQTDLRFHLNQRLNCHELFIRDINSGVAAIGTEINNANFFTSLMYFSSFTPEWRPQMVSHASFTVLKNESLISKQPMWYWSQHPSFLFFMENKEHREIFFQWMNFFSSESIRSRLEERLVLLKNSLNILAQTNDTVFANHISPSPYKTFPVEKLWRQTIPVSSQMMNLAENIKSVSQQKILLTQDDLQNFYGRNQSLGIYKELESLKEIPGASGPIATFLYRKESPQETHMIFLVRGIIGPNYKIELADLKKKKFFADNIQNFLGSAFTLDQWHLYTNELRNGEGYSLAYFVIPKKKELQYIK
ncbi:MAG TPA: hypothetical protein VIG33_07315, partial [Pseudobdellovibrionaceae bacterium]